MRDLKDWAWLNKAWEEQSKRDLNWEPKYYTSPEGAKLLKEIIELWAEAEKLKTVENGK